MDRQFFGDSGRDFWNFSRCPVYDTSAYTWSHRRRPSREKVQQGPLPRVWQKNKMSRDKDVKQIVPDMNEFEIDDVVSILMGSTPDSEIQIEYEDEGSEEESEN